MSTVIDRHLTMKALEMALQRRSPGEGLVHHSDRGPNTLIENPALTCVQSASSITHPNGSGLWGVTTR